MKLRVAICVAALAGGIGQSPTVWGQLAPRMAARGFRQADEAPAELPLAADGYCVVTLRDQHQWRPGEPAIGARFDGRQYRFAGPRELEIFAAAPVTYAPVLGGDCIVTYAESGQRVAGKAEFGVSQGGRLYFFAGQEQRARFMAAPAQYADADVADGGRCLVSRADQGREVAGLPDAAVLVGGLRRQFAGAYERSLYLQNPKRYHAASATADAPLPAGPTISPLAAASGSGSWRAATEPTSTPNALPAEGPANPADGGGATAEDVPLAAEPLMGGYCPVSIRQKGLWVRGQYDAAAQVDNLDFFTAGPDEREAFLADPAQYMPALAGHCVVSFADQGEKRRGSVFHATQYQGRLYLFADAAAKATFDAGPARYALLDVAANGACPVTLAETGQTVPGVAEFAVWHNGLLYRFASAEQKAKFLATPDRYAERPNAAAP